MGGSWSSSSSSSSSEKRVGSEMALPKAKDIVASTPVVVFSKTYCPYCNQVKQLLAQLGANFKAIELDVKVSDGSEIQSALLAWTGQRTVPNVFIGGKHIGGCDTVTAKHNEGKLVPLLTEAGALATAAA
ncbi:Glutaredoxin [Ananas comosus]|uniref:Glutaredoxin n=1 Tax=Ananas comosus TaxID=4615 RepID=A0A199V9E6_ANACO|nr:Glutaredoxin [Ananas comosus]